MLGCFTLSQRSLRFSSFLLILFSFLSLLHLFPPFYLLPHIILSSVSVILLMVPSRVFWSHLLHYSFLIDFFNSSRSLLNISCIFSILVSRLFICNSILFWILYHFIIILNSFSGRFLISSSFVWLGGHFSCFFTFWVFLCLFILFRLLCLEWPFCILVVCTSFLLWRFLPVGGVGRLACQGLLVREAFVGVLVHGVGFFLSGLQWSV